ncbi:MAG: hypothetical protein HYT08_04735 [Candidatus Levybacteria bacterium]|nr:hypothetical protein [Candidatus Levybacteria bacterium]
MAIIAVLAVVVFVALNPAQRLEDTRDAKRVSDTQSILTAIHASIVDNAGALPSGLTAGMVEKQIGTEPTAANCAIATGGCNVGATNGCVDLSGALANYLNSIPLDPSNGTAALTGYSVVVNAAGLVTVKACGTEGSPNISASR